jgi:hypothetical protein
MVRANGCQLLVGHGEADSSKGVVSLAQLKLIESDAPTTVGASPNAARFVFGEIACAALTA